MTAETPCAKAARIRLGLISEGTHTWPLYVAQSLRLFERAHLDVSVTVTGSSVKQQQALIGGVFDVGFQQPDHVVRAVEAGADLCIFAPHAHAPEVTLVAAPDIEQIGALRGRAIAVDGARTGYALLLRRLLREQGIPESDARFVEFGGAKERFDALRTGAAAACLLNPPFDAHLVAAGFKALARIAEAFPTYPGSVMAARRSWAREHVRELRAFVGALREAYGWLQNPANAPQALRCLPERLALAPRAATAALERYADRQWPQITEDGLRQVIDVVWASEAYRAPQGSPGKYMDLTLGGWAA